MGTTTTQTGGIESDVACIGCGYNLRGLDEAGKCPECGGSIAEALADLRRRMRREIVPLDAADPVWLRCLIEGIGFSIAGFFMILVLAAAPYDWYALRSGRRVVMLCIACIACVFCWFGAWKTAQPDPTNRDPLRGRTRWLVRFSAGWHLGFALLAGILPHNPVEDWLIELLVLPAVVILALPMILGGICYYPYLFQLARRTRSRALRAGTVILAVAIGPLMLTAFMPGFGSDSSSLGQLTGIPLSQYGPISMPELRGFFYYLAVPGFYSRPDILGFGGLLAFFTAGAFHVVVFLTLGRAIGAARRNTVADGKSRDQV